MFRKKRQPAPFFHMPGAPFNPATGERAGLGQIPNKGTTLALFQVIEADTHDNYVVCRGHEADDDPYFRYLHDPYTKPDTTPINVAKPYSVRGTFPYVEGQIIVAARIKGKLGFNPGKASVTVGQPADLDEETELLLDDAAVGIAWMDVATPASVDYGDCGIIVLPSGTQIDACDWTAGTLVSGIPLVSTEGPVYVPSSVGAGFAYASIGTKTIVNVLPFAFKGVHGSMRVAVSAGGIWVVRGYVTTDIYFSATGSSYSGSYVQWNASTVNTGSIATVSGNTITITCPATLTYDLRLLISNPGAGTEWDLYKNGSLTRHYDTTPDGGFYDEMLISLTEGDTLKVFYSGSPSVSTVANLSLHPRTGMLH